MVPSIYDQLHVVRSYQYFYHALNRAWIINSIYSKTSGYTKFFEDFTSLQIKAIKISNENSKFLHCAGLASVLMVYLWPNRNWWYQCQLQIYPLSLSLTLCPTPVSRYAHSCRQFRPESNEWWCFQVHNGEKFFIKYLKSSIV